MSLTVATIAAVRCLEVRHVPGSLGYPNQRYLNPSHISAALRRTQPWNSLTATNVTGHGETNATQRRRRAARRAASDAGTVCGTECLHDARHKNLQGEAALTPPIDGPADSDCSHATPLGIGNRKLKHFHC